jgi:peroxiredoxin Q/BCP
MPLIEEGKKAPAFTLPDEAGKKRALKDYAGRPVVLYFYPKDSTSGCTKEACAFRDELPKFKKSKAVVLGVSPDSEQSHARFAEKHGLNFTLLADVPGAGGTPKVCDRYGVWQDKSMYGRKYKGVVRTTYLIDAGGKVARRWDKVKVDGHAEDVLAAIRAL